MKKWEKMYVEIAKQVNVKEYNKWFSAMLPYKLSKRELFLIFTGFRIITRATREKYPAEYLGTYDEK